MKKTAKVSGFNNDFKPILPRKKRRNGVLEDGSSGKNIGSKVQINYLWSLKTGNTIEFNSIDIKEECLIEKTSFNYGKSGVLVGGDPNQIPTGLKIKTKKTLGKPLGKINFSLSNVEDDVLLDALLEFSLPLKNLTFEKAEEVNILVNADLKKSTEHSDRAVVLKKIPVGTLVEAVHAALSEFGSIKSIKMQLMRL
ncbi:hypothetical protein G9A89_003479 [Geosiphon pyriformis]|nr:hypothetical protein G9A89_003479 [Geosiphon pyriformis]